MSADRRDPMRADRRRMLPRDGGRRLTDPEPTHGTRARYQRGACRCTRCRAANAAYWLAWYHAKQDGKPLLGTRINAARTHILMKVIRSEAISNGDLDDALDWWGNYARVRKAKRITLRTALKVARFYRLQVALPFDSSANA